MPRIKVVVIGNGTLASKGLEVLRRCVDVPLVIADVRDNGSDTWRISLAKSARKFGFKDGETLLQPKNPNDDETVRCLRSVEADILLSLQCRHIIREPLFRSPRLATLNVHNAPLPLLRGCDPFAWAIHDGLRCMGVTLHQILDDGVDNGPVVEQKLWSISNDSTAWDLYEEGLDQSVRMLEEFFSQDLPLVFDGVLQEERYVTYHSMGQFDFSLMEIDWTIGADTLSSWIRSRIFPPFHLPFFRVGTRTVEVLRCRKTNERGSPGTVLKCKPLTIAVKRGAIEFTTLKIDGQRMGFSAADFLGLHPQQSINA